MVSARLTPSVLHHLHLRRARTLPLPLADPLATRSHKLPATRHIRPAQLGAPAVRLPKRALSDCSQYGAPDPQLTTLPAILPLFSSLRFSSRWPSAHHRMHTIARLPALRALHLRGGSAGSDAAATSAQRRASAGAPHSRCALREPLRVARPHLDALRWLELPFPGETEGHCCLLLVRAAPSLHALVLRSTSLSHSDLSETIRALSGAIFSPSESFTSLLISVSDRNMDLANINLLLDLARTLAHPTATAVTIDLGKVMQLLLKWIRTSEVLVNDAAHTPLWCASLTIVIPTHTFYGHEDIREAGRRLHPHRILLTIPN